MSSSSGGAQERQDETQFKSLTCISPTVTHKYALITAKQLSNGKSLKWMWSLACLFFGAWTSKHLKLFIGELQLWVRNM